MRSLRGLALTMLMAGAAHAAAPAEETPVLAPEQMTAEQLRAQIERTRALNAQLEAERKELQQNLAKLEAQVAAKRQLLKESQFAAASAIEEPAPWWRTVAADVALVLAVLLAVAGFVFYWRRRTAGKAA